MIEKKLPPGTNGKEARIIIRFKNHVRMLATTGWRDAIKKLAEIPEEDKEGMNTIFDEDEVRAAIKEKQGLSDKKIDIASDLIKAYLKGNTAREILNFIEEYDKNPWPEMLAIREKKGSKKFLYFELSEGYTVKNGCLVSEPAPEEA